MEPLFSLRHALHTVLAAKLMTEEEERVWGELIDQLDDTHLHALWELFEVEHRELPAALQSLDTYLPYLSGCELRRQEFFRRIEQEDRGLSAAVTTVLQSKRHWTSAQIEQMFATDESVAHALATLSIRDLEQLRKIVDLHEQAGEYEDEGGKATGTHATLTGILSFLEEETWEREQEAAKALLFLSQSVGTAMLLGGLVRHLRQIQSHSPTSAAS
jgi:hypothetical protein